MNMNGVFEHAARDGSAQRVCEPYVLIRLGFRRAVSTVRRRRRSRAYNSAPAFWLETLWRRPLRGNVLSECTAGHFLCIRRTPNHTLRLHSHRGFDALLRLYANVFAWEIPASIFSMI